MSIFFIEIKNYLGIDTKYASMSVDIHIPKMDKEILWGYSYDEWKNDIIYLFKKKVYSESLSELKRKREKLSSLYSKELKDFLEIKQILNEL